MSNPREEAAKVPSEQAIQRYRHDLGGDTLGTSWAILAKDDRGLVVYYADHAAIVAAQQQRIDALEAANAELTAHANRLEGILTGATLEETAENLFAVTKGRMNTRSVYILADELMQAARTAPKEETP